MLKRERENKLMNLAAMSSAISHEVRQPLAAIGINGEAALDLLEHSPPDLEEARSALKDIISDSHRTSEIFKNLRGLFGKPARERQAINVNEIVLRVMHILRAELEHKNIITDTSLSAELPLVTGQDGQLQEVVINLVQNAIDAMAGTESRARVLRIRTAPHGNNEIAVSVEDSGPGINANEINNVFDAFVTTKDSGMGLGLTICRMIVEDHGGTLSASSSAESGTVFQFVLPVK
jgi:C4-dicarboxylate-specific signal transduction histidine kinase